MQGRDHSAVGTDQTRISTAAQTGYIDHAKAVLHSAIYPVIQRRHPTYRATVQTGDTIVAVNATVYRHQVAALAGVILLAAVTNTGIGIPASSPD